MLSVRQTVSFNQQCEVDMFNVKEKNEKRARCR